MANYGLPGGQRGGFLERGQGLMGQAAQSFSQQDRVMKQNPPGKTAGGALMGGLSGAAAGATVGTMVGGPGWGTAIGAVVGMAGYMLS